jgi:hypothetical protein
MRMNVQMNVVLHPSGDGVNRDPPEARERALDWDHRMVFQPE